MDEAFTLTEGAAQITQITSNDTTTLSMAGDDLTTDTVTGAAAVIVNAASTGNLDLTDVDVSLITLNDDFVGETITTADAATLTLGAAQTGTVTVAGDSANTTNTVTINASLAIATLDIQDNGLTTTINLTDDVTIGTALTATGEAVLVTGAGDLVVTTSDATSFDASALTGDLTYTSTVGATILGATGANTIVSANANSSYIGQNGINTVTAGNIATTFSSVLGTAADIVNLTALTTGTVVLQTGAGDDTVNFKTAANIAAGAKITIDGGAGTDTLAFALDDDLSAATTLAITNVEEITLASGVDIAVKAAMMSGATYTVTGAAGTETFELKGLATAQTIDASDITIDSTVETFTITGGAAADTIIGSATADVIVGAAGNDTITGGEGDDTITGGAGNDAIILTETTAAIDTVVYGGIATDGVDTITGFAAGAGADILSLADLATVGTTGDTAAVFAAETTALVTAGSAYVLTADTAATDIIEITTTLDDDVVLSASSTGANLLQALSSDDTAAASITFSNADDVSYILVYQNSNAYLFHADSGASVSNTALTADEITLVGVFNDVAVGAFASGDIIMA